MRISNYLFLLVAFQTFAQVCSASESSPIASSMEMGRREAQKGHYEAAIKIYDAAIAAHPNICKWRLQRLEALTQVHQPQRVVLDCNAVLAQSPNQIDILHRRAWAFWELNLKKKTLADWLYCEKLEPSDPLTLQGLEVCYTGMGDKKDSESTHSKAIKFGYTDNCMRVIDVALHQQWAKRSDAAIALLRRQLKQTPQCPAIYIALADAFLDSPASREVMGKADELTADDVLRMLDKALTVAPPKAHYWRMAHVLEGRIYATNLKYEEAIQHYNLALSGYDPQSKTSAPISAEALGWAFHNRAIAYMVQHKFADACRDFESAYSLWPRWTESLMKLAGGYEKEYQFDKALATYARIIDVDPDDWEAHLLREKLFVEMKRFQDALAEANYLIKISPSDDERFAERAKIYMALKNYDKAVSDYTAAVAIMPASRYYKGRAAAYNKMDMRASAKADEDRAEKVLELP